MTGAGGVRGAAGDPGNLSPVPLVCVGVRGEAMRSRSVLVAMILLVGLLAAGCGGGAAERRVDELEVRVDQLRTEVDQLLGEVGAARRQRSRGNSVGLGFCRAQRLLLG